MMEALGIAPQSALFVGDNPEKDGVGARGAGMRYVRVATSADRLPTSELPYEIVIENLRQLPRVLIQLNRILK
jgi:FMN phosphatase YigB (HAD superfamily)